MYVEAHVSELANFTYIITHNKRWFSLSDLGALNVIDSKIEI